MILPFVLGLMLGASPVDEARAHLKAGKLDDVLFALDGKKLDGAEKAKGAQVLGEAAKAALEKKDPPLALQFAQMALKLDPKQTLALEAGSHAAKAQEQFETADSYADRWLEADPKSGEAHVWRAELAIAAGEWKRALAVLDGVQLDPGLSARADAVKARANAELSDRDKGMSDLQGLQKQFEDAQRKAAQGKGPAFAPGKTHDVVLYSASWCQYCGEARNYFDSHGIRYTEKDVQNDAAAQKEMIDKAIAGRVQPSGLPVIDVKGRLMVGWNEREFERLWQQ